MKKRFLPLLIVSLFAISFSINAQDEKQMTYLFQGENLKVSGFGGPIMGFSAIQDDFAFFMGGGGAVLLNQTFYLGGYGMGLTTSHYMTLEDASDDAIIPHSDFQGRIEFGHGGLWFGYIHQSKKPIHFGASSKFGWGSINLYDPYFDKDHSRGIYYDNVFVLTPQIEVEFNMSSWLKFNVAAGYRIVTGINEFYQQTDGTTEKIFDSKDFSKPELTLGIYFGYFK